MESCVFCKIIAGEISAHTIYEDERVLVILDYRPVREGHCLIVPKRHFDYFINLPDELASHIVLIGNRLGRKIMETIRPAPKRVGFVVHGYIPHVHYHVIPQHDENDITSGVYASLQNGSVAFNAEIVPIANDDEQKQIVALLKMT